ncbi:MAG: hypothetical protein CVV42_08035 [Candidatus Riflebacteria bacterium HGW-Riflebacteria-2]|nr:MAG: hypothetical protein CVV42_08035 [Candidatus Riflebacteria bacterium HGW-Riflebacteria-2]
MLNSEGARTSPSGIAPVALSLVVATGFALIVFSTFLDFTPVCLKSWRAGGVGLPVMLSCMLGTVLALRRNYFTAFFIGIFAAFFLTHEIVVIYDNRAVELGKELTSDGWFRSVIQVYLDALQPGYGAFWGFIGATLASIVPLFGMAFEARQKNLEAAHYSSRQSQAYGTAEDDDYSYATSEYSDEEDPDEPDEHTG